MLYLQWKYTFDKIVSLLYFLFYFFRLNETKSIPRIARFDLDKRKKPDNPVDSESSSKIDT